MWLFKKLTPGRRGFVLVPVVVACLVTAARGALPASVTVVTNGLLNGAVWHQGQPFFDYAPAPAPLGCAAAMFAPCLLAARWPAAFPTVAYTDANGTMNSSHRCDGSAPFDWSRVHLSSANVDAWPVADRHATARLGYFAAVSRTMDFQPGFSATSLFPASVFPYGYTQLRRYTTSLSSVPGDVVADFEQLVSAARTDITNGFPVFVGLENHWVVGEGWAVDTNGTEYIALNFGWGGAAGWYNVRASDVHNGKPIEQILAGMRPRPEAYVVPVAAVVSNAVSLAWAVPPLYSNALSAVTVEVARFGDVTNTLAETFPSGHGPATPVLACGTVIGDHWATLTKAERACLAFGPKACGIYRFTAPVRFTATSRLAFTYNSASSSNVTLSVQAARDSVNWTTLFSAPLHTYSGADGDAWESGWLNATVSLASLAGTCGHLRILVQPTNGIDRDLSANLTQNGVWIAGLKLDGVCSPLAPDQTLTLPAAARTATVTDLTAGATCAFTVTPVCAPEALAGRGMHNVNFLPVSVCARVAGTGHDFLAGTGGSLAARDDFTLDFTTMAAGLASGNGWTTSGSYPWRTVVSGGYFSKFAGLESGSRPNPGTLTIDCTTFKFSSASVLNLTTAILDATDLKSGDSLRVSFLPTGGTTTTLTTKAMPDYQSNGSSFAWPSSPNFVVPLASLAGKSGQLVLTGIGNTTDTTGCFAFGKLSLTGLQVSQSATEADRTLAADAPPEFVSVPEIKVCPYNGRAAFTVSATDDLTTNLALSASYSRPDLLTTNNLVITRLAGNTWELAQTATLLGSSMRRAVLTLTLTDDSGNTRARDVVLAFTASATSDLEADRVWAGGDGAWTATNWKPSSTGALTNWLAGASALVRAADATSLAIPSAVAASSVSFELYNRARLALAGPAALTAGTATLTGEGTFELATALAFTPSLSVRSVRFVPNKRCTTGQDPGGVAMSEFEFYRGGAKLPWTGCAVTASAYSGEHVAGHLTNGISRATNSSTTDKWFLGGIADASFQNVYVQFTFDAPFTFDSYRWCSTDRPARNPLAWTLQVSNDGSTWTTVDTRAFGSDAEAQAVTVWTPAYSVAGQPVFTVEGATLCGTGTVAGTVRLLDNAVLAGGLTASNLVCAGACTILARPLQGPCKVLAAVDFGTNTTVSAETAQLNRRAANTILVAPSGTWSAKLPALDAAVADEWPGWTLRAAVDTPAAGQTALRLVPGRLGFVFRIN